MPIPPKPDNVKYNPQCNIAFLPIVQKINDLLKRQDEMNDKLDYIIAYMKGLE